MSFGLRGGPALLANMRAQPKRIATNVARGGLRAGAVVIQKEVQRLAPYESGLTRASIKVYTSTRGNVIRAVITTRGPHSFLAPMLEFGVDPHFISVSDADRGVTRTRRGIRSTSIRQINHMAARGSLEINGKFVGPSVHHPGFGEKPFFRPALDTKRKDAVTAIGAYIGRRLNIGDLSSPVLEPGDDV